MADITGAAHHGRWQGTSVWPITAFRPSAKAGQALAHSLEVCWLASRVWYFGGERGLLTMNMGLLDIIFLCSAIAFIALVTSAMGFAGLLVASAICVVTWTALRWLREWLL